MLSERTIINALILAAGLIIGPYLTISTFEYNFIPILIAGAVVSLLISFFYVGNRICALPLLGLSFTGNLNFLPYGLNVIELSIAVTILYYLSTYIALKQKSFKTGPRAFLYPMMIIFMIMLYHQQSFGLRIIGGTKEGSRPAIMMIASVITYLCGINMTNPPVAFLRRLPWYCLAVTAISNLPYLISTYAPDTDTTLVYLSSNLNLYAYFGDTDRTGALAAIGSPLQLILLAYFPIYTWWRPGRWWVIGLSLLSFWWVSQGGFRSQMALYLFTFMLGAWCHCSWRSLILLPPCIVAILAVDLVQSSGLVTLPLSIQRSLSFVPGNWDKDVEDSAKSSDDFRADIKRIYKQEYAAKSPLLGNGFILDTSKIQEDTAKSGDAYYAIKGFLDSKSFHVGWISVYDAVGVVGFAAFVLFGVSAIFMSGYSVFGPGREQFASLLPLKIYLFCFLTRDMVGYFTVFGSFPGSFTVWCAFAIIITQLRSLERKPDMSAAVRLPDHELFGLPELGSHWQVKPINETYR
ncbi:MAG: DUF3367 domain-containing protein [Methylacidiphilales bacterium]|nr:DUF3367 domain-containing protein [Candidatus Methylacidiphilales bacterium]